MQPAPPVRTRTAAPGVIVPPGPMVVPPRPRVMPGTGARRPWLAVRFVPRVARLAAIFVVRLCAGTVPGATPALSSVEGVVARFAPR